MSNLLQLPPKYRSWTAFYLAVERELKEQGATYAPHEMDEAELLKWLEKPDRVCRVPDNFEVEFEWYENLFLDTDGLPMSERFWAAEQKTARILMQDVKLKIFEEVMQVLREREVLIQLRSMVRTHIPPTHPMFNEFERLIARVLEIT